MPRLLALLCVLLVGCEVHHHYHYDGCGCADAVVIDAPAIDAPMPIDAPVVDAPDVDAPAIDAPAIDAPAIDAPAIDAPDIDAPDIDAPDIDAPAIDAPIDAPPIDAPPANALLTIQFLGAGTGPIVVQQPPSGANVLVCREPSCTASVPANVTLTISRFGVQDSELAAWGGACTGSSPFGPCDLVLTGPTTVTVRHDPLAGYHWSRYFTRTYPGKVVPTPSGLYVNQIDGIHRYAADGTRTNLIPNPGPVQAIDVDPSGAITALRQSPPTELRRYSAAGVVEWTIAIPPSSHQVEVDVDGNSYILSADNYLRSFDPTGALRWEVLTATQYAVLDVRGDTVAVGGASGFVAWLGVYSRAGALRWTGTITGTSPMANIASVAVTSDERVAYVVNDELGSGRIGIAVHDGVGAPPTPPSWLEFYGSWMAMAVDETDQPLLLYDRPPHPDHVYLVEGSVSTQFTELTDALGIAVGPDGRRYFYGTVARLQNETAFPTKVISRD